MEQYEETLKEIKNHRISPWFYEGVTQRGPYP